MPSLLPTPDRRHRTARSQLVYPSAVTQLRRDRAAAQQQQQPLGHAPRQKGAQQKWRTGGVLLPKVGRPNADEAAASPRSFAAGASSWDPMRPDVQPLLQHSSPPSSPPQGGAQGGSPHGTGRGSAQDEATSPATWARGRAAATSLDGWLCSHIAELDVKYPPRERARDAEQHVSYMRECRRAQGVAVGELVRLVGTSCAEWGRILERLWSQAVGLFDRLADMYVADKAAQVTALSRAEEDLQRMRYNYLVAVERLESAVRARGDELSDAKRRERQVSERHAIDAAAVAKELEERYARLREEDRQTEQRKREEAEAALEALRREFEHCESGQKCRELADALSRHDDDTLRLRLQLLDAQHALTGAGRQSTPNDYSLLSGAQLRRELEERLPGGESSDADPQTNLDDLGGTARAVFLDGIVEWCRTVCRFDTETSAFDDCSSSVPLAAAPSADRSEDVASPVQAKRRARRGSGLPGQTQKKGAAKGLKSPAKAAPPPASALKRGASSVPQQMKLAARTARMNRSADQHGEGGGRSADQHGDSDSEGERTLASVEPADAQATSSPQQKTLGKGRVQVATPPALQQQSSPFGDAVAAPEADDA
eukprot:TRINITY_DN15436_c0_g1_i1.p1 TRINITY_DN15436_c0_g1~~TRINITY_DN15436_c0_g1_i1.p1  ORF type:complete len:616 (+),score=203.28 TRINITY_DN15436_c0_g1_i1:51-1850(+)